MLIFILRLVLAYILIALFFRLLRAAIAGYLEKDDHLPRTSPGRPRPRDRFPGGRTIQDAEWEEIREDPPAGS